MLEKDGRGLLVFSFWALSCAFAQPCPQGSCNLACVIPLEYGPTGFGFTNAFLDVPGTVHATHFNTEFVSDALKPLTQAIGRQVNLVPLAAPSSGIVFDPSVKTFVTITDSLGPILGERAETLGRHRL